MTTTTETQERCPFCGSNELQLSLAKELGDRVFVECDDCCTMGPGADTAALAIEAWNKRAAPPAQPEHQRSRHFTNYDIDAGTFPKHGAPAQPEAFVHGGGGARGCELGAKVLPPAVVSSFGPQPFPPAPAPSATPALDVWLESHDVMQSTRSELRHCYGADLAALRASKVGGLPAIGEPAEAVEYASESETRWTKLGVVFSSPTCQLDIPGWGKIPVRLADEGKTWRRRVPGEKGVK